MQRIDNHAEQAEVVILSRHIRIAIREKIRVCQNITTVIATVVTIDILECTDFVVRKNFIQYLLLSEPVTIETNPDKGDDCLETAVTSSVIFWNCVKLSIELLLKLHYYI